MKKLNPDFIKLGLDLDDIYGETTREACFKRFLDYCKSLAEGGWRDFALEVYLIEKAHPLLTLAYIKLVRPEGIYGARCVFDFEENWRARVLYAAFVNKRGDSSLEAKLFDTSAGDLENKAVAAFFYSKYCIRKPLPKSVRSDFLARLPEELKWTMDKPSEFCHLSLADAASLYFI